MAEFLTVNLNDILRNQKSFADLEPITRQDEPEVKRDLKQISNWAKELESRLAQNRALDASKRKTDYEVEDSFFKDYFEYGDAAWDTNSAELLLSIGDPLRKAIKVLGFDPNVNPILGFLTNNYVINSLLLTKLLNVNTFKAVYNAVSKRLIADSELMTNVVHDYNIVYCPDLYRRSAAEIIEYLTVQKTILKPSASTYTEADQELNKKIFFKISGIKELDSINEPNTKVRYKKIGEVLEKLDASSIPDSQDPTTKLNELPFVKALAKLLTSDSLTDFDNQEDDSNEDDADSQPSTDARVEELARKIGNNNARAFAAIQYLSATTSSTAASKALSHEAFKNITIYALVKATQEVSKAMKEIKISNNEVQPFIKLLLRKLKKDT